MQRIQASRQKALEAYGRVVPSFLADVPMEGEWTALDIVAHLESWEYVCLEPLQEMAQGHQFRANVIIDHDAWNHARYSDWKGQSAQEILRRSQATRQALIAALEALPAEAWSLQITLPWGEHATLVQMVSGLAWHEEEHTKSILTALNPGVHGSDVQPSISANVD